MTAPGARADYRELLYRLLPGVYRSRDSAGELERFTGVFGHALERLRGNIDQLYRDLFIDSCQDWVIPYLGDLIDANLVFQRDASRTRAEVRSTMRWRRQKGTRDSLEDIAAEVGGWGAFASELYTRLVWSQNLAAIRPRSVHAIDLAAGTSLSRLSTPFDTSTRSVDLRPGGHQIRNVGIAVWPIPARPRSGAEASREAAGRWRFDPLGRDAPLLAGKMSGDSDAGALRPRVRDTYIRVRDLHDHPESYLNQPWGFTIREDGIPLCAAGDAPAPAPSVEPAAAFYELARDRGLLADGALIGGRHFRVSVVRLASLTRVDSNGDTVPVAGSPAGAFGAQFAVDGLNGDLETPAMVYSKGIPYNPGAPAFHHPYLLVRIERTGADANFPECELVARNAAGAALLVYVPAIAGMAPGAQHHFYAASDGSTYFARAGHGSGAPDLNPNSGMLGAFLPRHLARASLGQVRPRPGLRPVQFRRLAARELCCFNAPHRPPAAGELAADPTRGRFAVPPAEDPAGVVTVDYQFGFTGDLGAGPYFRGEFGAPDLTVSRAGDADHTTIQAAIAAAPVVTAPVIIEIADSATYRESLVVNRAFPGGLVLRARALEMPVVQSAGGDVLSATNSAPFIQIDGLTMAGGLVRAAGAITRLHIRFSTLDPATSGVNYIPANPGAELRIESAISGPVTASPNVARVAVEDSAVQNAAGGTALDTAGLLTLDRSTIAGDTQCHAIDASNSILFGALDALDAAASCLRYSRHAKSASPTRRFRTTTAWPIFLSLRHGDPGWLHLSPNTSPALLSGGEEAGEMGVFYNAAVGGRARAVTLKLDEYLPAGLRVSLSHALPPRRFPGVIQP